jgi:YbbR domain-containing protein
MVYKKGLLLIRQKSSKMFLLAFLVSLTIWFLINLSKTYERTITVKVSFKNLEKGTFVKSADSILKVKIKGSGFTLLSHNLSDLELNINTDGLQDKWTWGIDDSGLSALFSKDINVLNVTPRTVGFDIKKLIKKKVPIISKIKVSPKLGYGITTFKLAKDSISIYGEQMSIDTISHINTDSLIFKESTSSFKDEVRLDVKNNDIQIEHKEIEYSYIIERFTQGDFAVGVKIKNAPDDKTITVFPKEIHIRFQAPLSQFANYKSEDFGVYVDYNDVNDTSMLPIYIEYFPEEVKNTRVLKKSVTYLILEK